MLPIANVMVRPILTFLEDCIFHTIGMGSISITTSVIMFMSEDQRNHALMLKQRPPGIVRSHKNSRGIQLKKPAIAAPMEFPIIPAATIQHIILSDRWVKIRRYIVMMASFGKITATR